MSADNTRFGASGGVTTRVKAIKSMRYKWQVTISNEVSMNVMSAFDQYFSAKAHCKVVSNHLKNRFTSLIGKLKSKV